MIDKTQTYTEVEAKKLIDEQGSSIGIKNPASNITEVDFNKPITTWIFSPGSKNKIIKEEIEKSIDVKVSELKPNIPTTAVQSVSLEEYNNLLARLNSANLIVNQLRQSNKELNATIGGLTATTDAAIVERLAKEQINDVILNQLESLASSISQISDQLSKTIQKSIEESVIRSSLQAQNEGFKAQINALLAQIDSLNSIIQGLYNQLGAVQVQTKIDVEADSLAQQLRGYSINSVVMYPEIPKCKTWKADWDSATAVCYPWWAVASNTAEPVNFIKWVAGGKMTFKNLNRVQCRVIATVQHPYNDLGGPPSVRVPQKFFTLSRTEFDVSAGQEISITPEFTKSLITQNKYSGSTKIETDVGSHTTEYGYGFIKLEVRNLVAGTSEIKILPVGFSLLQGRDQYDAYKV